MLNVYEQVSFNKRRSLFIMVLFVTFICGAAYLISYFFDLGNLLPIAAVFSIFSSLGSYFFGDKIVLSLNQAHPANRQEYFDFYTVTENLSLANSIPMPKIYVIESSAPNAFATGRDPNHAYICATTGLLAKLNRTELEGVIAHELSHIKNYDILLMTVVSVLIGTLTIFINLTQRSMFYRNRDDDNRGNPFAIIGLILIVFAPLIAQLIQLAISRRREYFADASAVKITRQPSGLISALQKISQDSQPLKTASTATASLYIVNPFKGNKLASLFSTHPPIEDRIAVLEKMA